MARNFKELQAKMDPVVRAANEVRIRMEVERLEELSRSEVPLPIEVRVPGVITRVRTEPPSAN